LAPFIKLDRGKAKAGERQNSTLATMLENARAIEQRYYKDFCIPADSVSISCTKEWSKWLSRLQYVVVNFPDPD
jgi:hypothetical protein